MPEASRVLVISPHFDDAVFSCGAWIASHSGAVVCTVFAGDPNGHVTTDWDRQCGFTDARHAMRERIAEDDRALDTLGVASEHLNFVDAQYVPYGAPPTADAIEHALCTIIRLRQPTTLAIPLGLYTPITFWSMRPAEKRGRVRPGLNASRTGTPYTAVSTGSCSSAWQTLWRTGLR